MAESAALLVDEVLPHEPMRAQLSLPTKISVRHSLRTDEQGAEYRLPRYCITSHQKSRTNPEDGAIWYSNTYPAVG